MKQAKVELLPPISNEYGEVPELRLTTWYAPSRRRRARDKACSHRECSLAIHSSSRRNQEFVVGDIVGVWVGVVVDVIVGVAVGVAVVVDGGATVGLVAVAVGVGVAPAALVDSFFAFSRAS